MGLAKAVNEPAVESSYLDADRKIARLKEENQRLRAELVELAAAAERRGPRDGGLGSDEYQALTTLLKIDGIALDDDFLPSIPSA